MPLKCSENVDSNKPKWNATAAGGFVLDSGSGFFISYNPYPSMWMLLLQPADTGRAETALVVHGPETKYYILNGDFRHEYEEVISHGLDACLAVYQKYKMEYGSSRSTRV